jgi:hypothetical protein
MEPKGSLPCSQQLATDPCPKPDEPGPHLPNPISLRSILKWFSHRRLGLPSGLFPSGFPTKNIVRISHLSHAPHLILFDLITLITFG